MWLVTSPTVTLFVWPELSTPYWTTCWFAPSMSSQVTVIRLPPPARVTLGVASLSCVDTFAQSLQVLLLVPVLSRASTRTA